MDIYLRGILVFDEDGGGSHPIHTGTVVGVPNNYIFSNIWAVILPRPLNISLLFLSLHFKGLYGNFKWMSDLQFDPQNLCLIKYKLDINVYKISNFEFLVQELHKGSTVCRTIFDPKEDKNKYHKSK